MRGRLGGGPGRRYGQAMNALSPIVSEFETEEQAASYDLWFRRKVEAALADERPAVPHDEAMARVQAALDRGAKKRSC